MATIIRYLPKFKRPITIPLSFTREEVEAEMEALKIKIITPNDSNLTNNIPSFNDDEDYQLLTRLKTMQYCGICETTLDSLIKDGILPHIKIGHRTLIRKGDVRKFIENNIRYGHTKNRDKINDEILTQKQVLEYVKIGRTSLHKLMKAKAFPFMRIKRKLLFRWCDIDKFLKSKNV